MSAPRPVSIVIPTLNEARTLKRTLEHVRDQEEPFEVIVVDGGSSDGTVQLAQSAGVRVLQSSNGRAEQMNRGAAHAEGTILLFLHADTLLPSGGLATIRRTLRDPTATSGTFRLTFDRSTPLLRFYAWCTRWPWIRLCFGDRGQFVRRDVFEAVGGFPDWPLFEDLELADRLRQYGGFRFLDTAVTTSARRFRRQGTVRQQIRNLYLWAHYMAGTDPHELQHLYPQDHPDPAPPELSR